MATFYESDSNPIASELVRQGFTLSRDEVLRIVDIDEKASSTDTAIAIGTAAISLVAACGTLALSGFTLPILAPIAALGYAGLTAWNSRATKQEREFEAEFLHNHPEFVEAVNQKLKSGEESDRVAAAYEHTLKAFIEGDAKRMQSFLPAVEVSLPMAPYPNDALPTATSSPIGNTTRLGAIDVPSSTAAHSPATKSGFFDFNSLRTEPDNYTGFAIVGDMGTGKTRLIKYLARNILTTGRMSVMDIYARNDDWQGATVITSVDDFLPEMVDELEAIDALTEAYRNGQTVFEPHLFVVEEAADTLAEASDRGRTESKTVARWLSKYLTITRKIGKRLCLVSVNIKDLTDAIGSAEKRNSMVFIFPGRAAIAKAMTDTYIFKLGTSENREQREKLERAIARINRPALIQHRGQWWVAEIPEVNADGSLMDGSSPTISSVTQATEPKTEAKPKTASTAEDLNRMFNMPSAETEIEEDAIESVSSRSSIQSAFPNWKPKSQDIAAKVIDWMIERADKSFLPSEVRNGIRTLKSDKEIDNDRVKKLLDLLADKQLISVDESGRYSLLQQSTDDDYNF
jgi:hypothetical protein